MKVILFYHSLLSDWNHGNAHFLRGVVTELVERGNEVVVYEPQDNWSLANLVQDYGEESVSDFYNYYPGLQTNFYNAATIDLDMVLAGADLVLVHEWNDHGLVKAIGEKRRQHNFRLLFHDTHHRAVTEKQQMAAYDLTHYDGVLAFGNVIREIYQQEGWARKAWTWHEAADTRIFKPLMTDGYDGDLVWVGNWGDEERTKELHHFLIEPVKELDLKASIYGVRYPAYAKASLAGAGIEYRGWLPNYKAPEVFARHRFTVHVPRRPYVEALPGIPTIRPFEALACGIPLISAPWEDAENLFTPGKDFLVANNKAEMKTHIIRLLADHDLVRELTAHGLQTIVSKHTCAHRVDELYAICRELQVGNFAETQKPILTMDDRP